MARRILSADNILAPQSQPSLNGGDAPASAGGLPEDVQQHWQAVLGLPREDVLFDWYDQSALQAEIAFVNRVRERIDEAVVKVAPAMLRIVLTVKANLPDADEQRRFLHEHVDWDFRRISELCIVAESYRLLDPTWRQEGAREIERFGWSNALKLAYVRDPAERAEIWDNARGDAPRASYRAVLEELRRFRERKQIGPPAPESELTERLEGARRHFQALSALESADLTAPDTVEQALKSIGALQKELRRMRTALRERLEGAHVEQMAREA